VTYRYVIDPDFFRVDFAKALEYYAEVSPGRVDSFQLAIDKAISKIVRYPLLNRELEWGYRRYLIPSLPYMVLYVVKNDTLVIAGLQHTKSDPRRILHVLRNRTGS
jgi:plasmid stabilization system protein ParE